MKVTFKKALKAVNQVIDQFGEDYHYKTHREECEYYRVDADNHFEVVEPVEGLDFVPGCLIGEAFLVLGHSITEQSPINDQSIWPEGVELTPKAVKFLLAAQNSQDGTEGLTSYQFKQFDGGTTWGRARDYALEYVK